MKKTWKCYLAFVPLLCRILLFGILPALLVAIMLIARGGDFEVLFLITGELILTVFIMADNWCFGGIARKTVGLPEYMKSSRKGRAFMENAVWVSAVIPIVITVGIWITGMLLVCIPFGYAFPTTEDIRRGVNLLCGMETLVLLGYTLSRFSENMWINMLTAWIASLLMGGWNLLAEAMTALTGILTGFGLMLVMSAIYWQVMKWRMEGSYYDKRD